MELNTEHEDSYTRLSKNSSTVLSPKKHKKYYVMTDKDRDEVKDLCIKYVPFWNNLDHDDIEVEIVTHAITNRVFVVSLVSSDKSVIQYNKIIVKKTTPFGVNFYDRELQYQVSKLLGEHGIGPKILARNAQYTIQEWIDGVFLNNHEYRNLSTVTSIASSLAKFHKKCTEIAPKEWDRTPFCLSRPEKWSKVVEPLFEKYDMGIQYSDLMNSFETYKKVISNHVKNSDSVANSVLFCHNDMFNKNILNLTYGVYVIDYDYAAFNYVGWDLANFFVNMSIIYISGPPYFIMDQSLSMDDEAKMTFAAVYLSCLLNKKVMPYDEMVKDFLTSVEVHRLGVHIFWPFWRVLMLNRPASELCIHVECHAHFNYHYTMFKEHLKDLKEKGLIEY